MSVRSAVGFPYTPNFPIGNQTLAETLANGNSANQQDITGVNNLDVFTINGGPIGSNEGLYSVLQVSNVANELDIQNVGTLTANKVVELGRESGFGYIANQVKTVTDATPFQIDISGGTLTLTQGSYLFNFKVNFSSATPVGNYTLQLFLDALEITESLITPTGGLLGATLIINSIPVTITGATGVVSLKGLVSTATFANVTIEGSGGPNTGASYYSYVEIYKGVSPPPRYYPFTFTSGSPFKIDVVGNQYTYYLDAGNFTFYPNANTTINEMFIVGGGKSGYIVDRYDSYGGNGGGVILYNTPISVNTNNIFDVVVGAGGVNSTTSVLGVPSLSFNTNTGTTAIGGITIHANNNGIVGNNGGDGTLYNGYYYGGAGGSGGVVYNDTGYYSGGNGGSGCGGGGGAVGIDGGNGGGNGVNTGGSASVSSQYGGGGGGRFETTYIESNGGNGGTGGGSGGAGGFDSGVDVGGGGGGGGGVDIGGGGGGGGPAIAIFSGIGDIVGGGGGGGSGIVIIVVTI